MRARVESLVALTLACAVVGWFLYVILDMGAGIVVHKGVAPPLEPARPPRTFAAPSNPQPAPIASPSQASGPDVYKCIVNGAALYSDAPCKGGKVVDIRITRGYEAPNASPRYQSRTVETASDASVLNSNSYSSDASRAGECRYLDEAIASIDADARIGGSIPKMEDLKARRQKLVDRKYELRC